MNAHTLSITRDERQQLDAVWRARVSRSRPAAAAFLLLAVLRGQDPLRGFTPITNLMKLANGQRPRQGYLRALASLAWQLENLLAALWPEMTDARRAELACAIRARLVALRAGVCA